ncbi:peptide ABC transporter substrate-binding protein [Fluviispira multicolorata]|uniref:Solute-binding protein family 5 domain-containing protein n=1 Tax=Fluviispira multicolorata TaxID=2654512 RepID=A0A833JER4_9BACT|nr:peptide ABC transporter substrate-binding protein [Fluviispira multicolorata]KAB8033336.1 hypothetical protein GCL57_01155 [Fluviispira multicolorata]
MQKKHLKKALITSISLFMCFEIFAAVIPVGTKLAKKQLLNKDNSSEITSLDPSLSSDNLSTFIIDDLYETLIVNNSQGKYVSGAATHWDISKDGLVYTFYLRKNAKWSDGKPVVANNFVYSFRRLSDPKTAASMAYMITMVKNADKVNQGVLKPEALGVKAINDHTLQITLEYSAPYFQSLATMSQLVPLRQDIIEKYGSEWTQAKNMVSNGAYILKEWKISDHISLERNKNYWDNKNTVIENVNYWVVTDKTAALRLYQAGQIDWTYGLPPGQVTKIKKEFKSEVKHSPSLSTSYLMFNTKAPPLDNLKLRKALALSVDRDDFAKYILEKGEKPLYDLSPYGIANYSQYEPEWAQWSSEKRIAEAKKLYAEAGYSRNNPAKISIQHQTNETDKKYVTAITSMWAKNLGVKTELSSSEWKVHINSLHEKKYQLTLRLWQADFDDALNFASLIEGNNAQNLTNHKNKKFDEMLAASNLETNLDKRKILIKEAMKIGLEDYSVSPIYSGTNMRLIKHYVQGAAFNNPNDHYPTKDLYIVSHDGNS